MKPAKCIFFIAGLFLFPYNKLYSQSLSNFVSVNPTAQTSNFIFPSATHRFQKIMEHGDVLPVGTMMDNFDFTGYMPIAGSSPP